MQKHAKLPQAFADLGIEPRFLKALAKMGFQEPSDIQRELIPVALTGRDVLGQARTGTGKTAAFGLPVLQQCDPQGTMQALCLVPTRELAVQVSAELQRLAEFSELHIVTIYGGAKMSVQARQLGRKPHVVVGTPGRVMDFMNRGHLDISRARFAVLDEVDRMLDIGFRDDIRAILSHIKCEHQTIFVSATIEDEIRRLSSRYMTDPEEINVSRDKLTVDNVDQSYVTVDRWDKFRLLRMILDQEDPPVCIVFCNTKAMTNKLAQKLHGIGAEAQAIQGDLIQRKREKVMDRFRKNKIRVLVATDLAARGIDVSSITHIINYDIPPDPEVYVHRIGRTARMGQKGAAITFVDREEGKELTQCEVLINREIPQRTVDGFTPSPPPKQHRSREQAPQPAPSPGGSRLTAPVSAGADEKKPPPRKTLGSRFKPRRSRRRL